MKGKSVAQQNLDFTIAAHTKGMEAIATLINRVGALEAEMEKVKSKVRQLDEAMGGATGRIRTYGNSLDAQSKALRNARQGTQQLGMQFNDLATSISTGASPIQAFNQQLGQIGFAMTMMGGRLGALGNFLAGPWGAAIALATMALTPFIEKLFGVGDAADGAKTALEELAAERAGAEAAMTRMNRAQEELDGLLSQEAELRAEIQRVSRGMVQGDQRTPMFAYRQYQELLAIQQRIREAQRDIFYGTVQRRNPVVQRQRAEAERAAAEATREAAEAARELARANQEAEAEIQRIRSSLRLAVNPAQQFRERLTGLSNAMRDGIITGTEFRNTVRDALGAKADGVELMRSQLEAWRRSLAAGLVTAAEYTTWLMSLPETVGRATTELRALNAELAQRNPAVAFSNFVLPESFVDQAKKQGEAIRDAMRGYTDDMKASFDSVGESVAGAFKGMLTSGMGWKDAMRGVIQSVIDQLWKLYITQQIVGFISGALKGIGMPMPAGKAVGGAVSARTPYMVGEKGPELFIPGGNGTIIPNNNVANGNGGNVISINVDARGSTDAAAVRAQVQRGILEAAPSIIAAAQQKTVSDMRRPRLGGVMQ